MADIKVRFNGDATNFNKTMGSVEKKVDNIGRSAKQASSSFAGWFKQNKKLGESFANINRDVNRASGGFASLGRTIKGFVGIAVLDKFLGGISLSIKASIDAIETQNLFQVSLGETAEQAEKTVISLSEVYGLNPNNLKSAIGTFALLSKSMGFSADQANTLSTQTAQMALDLSSLMNIPITQVMQDLKSGLVGQSETVYKYGIDVTEAGIKSEAMAEGITKSVRNMSQGEKMALRYNTMIRTITRDLGDGKTIMGDFARTINQPANQLKILQDRFVTLITAVGNMFMPLLEQVLPYLNAIVMALTEVADGIAKMFGYTPPDKTKNAFKGTKDNADDASDAIDDTTSSLKKLTKQIFGFDELNILKDPREDSSGMGGASILSAMELSKAYDEAVAKIKTKADEIKVKISQVLKDLKPFFQGFFEVFAPYKTLVTNMFDGIVKALEKFGKWAKDNPDELKKLGKDIGIIVDGFLMFAVGGKLATGIESFVKLLGVGSSTGLVGSLTALGGALSVVLPAFSLGYFFLHPDIMTKAISDLSPLEAIIRGVVEVFVLLGKALVFIMDLMTFGMFSNSAYQNLTEEQKKNASWWLKIFDKEDGEKKTQEYATQRYPRAWDTGSATQNAGYSSYPRMATGGIVTHSTFAEIGEAGAEAVIPLNSGKLEQYFQPIMGSMGMKENSYDTTYKAMKDALSTLEFGDNITTVQLDGTEVGRAMSSKSNRNIMRSGVLAR